MFDLQIQLLRPQAGKPKTIWHTPVEANPQTLILIHSQLNALFMYWINSIQSNRKFPFKVKICNTRKTIPEKTS